MFFLDVTDNFSLSSGGERVIVRDIKGVQSNVGKFFLDVTDNFSLSSGGERVSTFSEDLHQVVSEITSGKIETEDGVGKSVSFVDWDSVGYTITRIENNTSSTSGRVERKHSLDGNIHSWGVESFEHDLGHLFTVSFLVEWGFSEENWVFFRCNTEFIVESVMPDLFHIVPVGDNTVFNWVFQGEDTSLGLGFVSNV